MDHGGGAAAFAAEGIGQGFHEGAQVDGVAAQEEGIAGLVIAGKEGGEGAFFGGTVHQRTASGGVQPILEEEGGGVAVREGAEKLVRKGCLQTGDLSFLLLQIGSKPLYRIDDLLLATVATPASPVSLAEMAAVAR